MKSKSHHIKEIDILYSIGAILAVFGHSHPNNWASFKGSFFYYCIIFIYTFHMALFFFIAGVLLNNSKSIEIKPFKTFLKEKAFKLLTPYFILTLITFIPKGYLDYHSFNFLNLKYIFKIFLNPRANTWGHFWFLPVLFVCYLIFGLLKKLISKTKPATKTCILTATSLVFLVLVLCPPFNTNWLGLNDIFKFGFYMPLGMLLACMQRPKPLSSKFKYLSPICSMILLALSVVGYILFYNNALLRFMISLLMIWCLLGVAYLLRNKFEKTFGFLSKNIFTIYIYSWPFQSITLIVLEKLSFSWEICAPIMFITGILCPIILIGIYKRFKKLNCRFFDLMLGIR